MFSKGSVTRALLASAAIPAVFPPVRIGKYWYVDGAFSLEELPVAQPLRVRAFHPGHALSWSPPVLLEPGEIREDLILAMEPGGGIHGVVANRAGEAVEKAEISIKGEASVAVTVTSPQLSNAAALFSHASRSAVLPSRPR